MTEQLGSAQGVAEPSAGDTPAVCPWLGLIGDPATRYDFPSSAQVCHATRRPSDIAAAKQARDCLTARHPACSRYRPVTPTTPAPLATIVAEPPNRRAGPRLGDLQSRIALLMLLAALTAIAIAAGYFIGSRLAMAF